MDKNSFENLNCPVCYSKFFEDDDIVVCPICGAPHHRDCYNSLGHCKFEADHGTNKQWSAADGQEKQKSENKNEYTNSERLCPYCNSKLDSQTLFCAECGNPVNNTERTSNPYSSQPMHEFGQFVTYDPLGGISPDEDLGGASAIDCASYLKTNTANLIPKFSKMNRSKKKISWNWFSFVMPEFYFLYRKCYGFAVLAITAFVVFYTLQLPMMTWMQSLPGYADMQTNEQVTALMMNNMDQLSTINLAMSYIGLGLFLVYRIIFGMFGNLILKSSCIKKVSELKNESTIDDYQQKIALKGGVNILAVMIGYIALQFILIIITRFISGGVLG